MCKYTKHSIAVPQNRRTNLHSAFFLNLRGAEGGFLPAGCSGGFGAISSSLAVPTRDVAAVLLYLRRLPSTSPAPSSNTADPPLGIASVGGSVNSAVAASYMVMVSGLTCTGSVVLLSVWSKGMGGLLTNGSSAPTFLASKSTSIDLRCWGFLN
jgi:hypothetical protein